MSEQNPYAPPGADVAVSESQDLAERGTRLGGAIIDGLLLAGLIWAFVFASGIWSRMVEQSNTVTDTVLIFLVSVGAFLLLNGYLLAKHGQTIGKRLLNMRIVSVQDGRILPFWRVMALRYLPVWVIGYIPLVGSVFSLVNPLFIFREDRRCVHDLIAGTRVVKA